MKDDEVTRRELFERDGFVLLEGWLDPDQLARLEEEIGRFIRERVDELPREHVFYEDLADRATLKQIQQLGEHDERFHALQHEGRFPELAASLLGAPVVAKNLQYFNKPAGRGAATPPHQDGHYFRLAPCEAVTMWLALDPADEENGCVRYVRGSHRGPMRSHTRTSTLGFSQGIADYGTPGDLSREIAIEARPGDLLVHHAMTIHRADPNRSATRQRRALGFIYYSANAREDVAANEAYKEQLRRELLDSGEI